MRSPPDRSGEGAGAGLGVRSPAAREGVRRTVRAHGAGPLAAFDGGEDLPAPPGAPGGGRSALADGPDVVGRPGREPDRRGRGGQSLPLEPVGALVVRARPGLRGGRLVFRGGSRPRPGAPHPRAGRAAARVVPVLAGPALAHAVARPRLWRARAESSGVRSEDAETAYAEVARGVFELARELASAGNTPWAGSLPPASPLRAVDKYLWMEGGGAGSGAMVVRDPERVLRELGIALAPDA